VLPNAVKFVQDRYRLVVFAGLIGVALLAWIYILHLAATMGSIGVDAQNMEMSMPRVTSWQARDFLLTFLMWAVMMVAMMTPSVTPMVLAHAGLSQRQHPDERPYFATVMFLAGYLVVWALFSLGATFVQWGLHAATVLSPETIRVTPVLGGVLLIAAGVYQFVPVKYVCLANCRSPVSFLTTEWREGSRGALRMGIRHGVYCVGCCWMLMALLFVAGVMNLLWVALIAGYVLVEKAMPTGQWVARVMGLLTIGWGGMLLLGVLGG